MVNTSPYILEFSLPAEAADGQAESWLGPEEAAIFKSWSTAKRRLDWLLGRLAAKKALGRLLKEVLNLSLHPREIGIFNKPSGEPYARFSGLPQEIASKTSFSISHCPVGALGAAGFNARPIGVDWEMIANRGKDFSAFFCHESELGPDAENPLAQTRLWILKEATLKFLGLGLGCDPSDVRFRQNQGLKLHGRARHQWEAMGAPRIVFEEIRRENSLIAVAFT